MANLSGPLASGDVGFEWRFARRLGASARDWHEYWLAGHIDSARNVTGGTLHWRDPAKKKWRHWYSLHAGQGRPAVIHQMFPSFVREDVAQHLQAMGVDVDLAYREVVHAADCDEDGNCPWCKIDFAECSCPGPTSDDTEFITDLHGRLWGKPVATNDNGDKQR